MPSKKPGGYPRQSAPSYPQQPQYGIPPAQYGFMPQQQPSPYPGPGGAYYQQQPPMADGYGGGPPPPPYSSMPGGMGPPGYMHEQPHYNPAGPPQYQQAQPQVMVQGAFDAGARFNSSAQPTIPPPPPGMYPNAAQMAQAQGQTVVATQRSTDLFGGGSGGGYVFW